MTHEMDDDDAVELGMAVIGEQLAKVTVERDQLRARIAELETVLADSRDAAGFGTEADPMCNAGWDALAEPTAVPKFINQQFADLRSRIAELEAERDDLNIRATEYAMLNNSQGLRIAELEAQVAQGVPELVHVAAVRGLAWSDDEEDADAMAESWKRLPQYLRDAVNAEETRLTDQVAWERHDNAAAYFKDLRDGCRRYVRKITGEGRRGWCGFECNRTGGDPTFFSRQVYVRVDRPIASPAPKAQEQEPVRAIMHADEDFLRCIKCDHEWHTGECVNVAPQPADVGADEAFKAARKAYVKMTNTHLLIDDEAAYFLRANDMAAFDTLFSQARAKLTAAGGRDELDATLLKREIIDVLTTYAANDWPIGQEREVKTTDQIAEYIVWRVQSIAASQPAQEKQP